MSNRLLGIAERYDRQLAGATNETLRRIYAAYDVAYRRLIKTLRTRYEALQSAGAISTLVRQAAIATELGQALRIISPSDQPYYDRLAERLLQRALELGQQLGEDTLRYLGVQGVLTTVPVEAVRYQAETFAQRLVNYSERHASAISAAVEQGLVLGWGTRRVEGVLRTLGLRYKSDAETVARTETLAAYNGAALSRYQQAGVDYVQLVVTPAEGTCSLCYARNGSVYRAEQAPKLPAHPRCRCTYLPLQSLDDLDTDFYRSYYQAGVAALKRAGLTPNLGVTSWERQAGLEAAPKPVWTPRED